MLNSNKPIPTDDYVVLTKWDPLKAKKSKEETNTDYQINKEKMKLERRPLRRGRSR